MDTKRIRSNSENERGIFRRRNEKAHTDEPGVHQEKYKLRGSRRSAGADTLFMADCK